MRRLGNRTGDGLQGRDNSGLDANLRCNAAKGGAKVTTAQLGFVLENPASKPDSDAAVDQPNVIVLISGISSGTSSSIR